MWLVVVIVLCILVFLIFDFVLCLRFVLFVIYCCLF